MAEVSPRLGLPLLVAGQAQKEVVHNEALILLDALAQATAVAADATHPPADPVEGACWILGVAPTGAWAGHPDELAISTAGGWRFVLPRVGMRIWVEDRAHFARRTAGEWAYGIAELSQVRVNGKKVVGEQEAAILTPTGGVTVDAEARATISALLVMLRSHGLIVS